METKLAQKIDGTGKVHATTLGRRGGRVLVCSGRTMFDLVPVGPVPAERLCTACKAG